MPEQIKLYRLRKRETPQRLSRKSSDASLCEYHAIALAPTYAVIDLGSSKLPCSTCEFNRRFAADRAAKRNGIGTSRA